VDSYLAYEPKIYPKTHENPRVFSCISTPIFLESSSHSSSDGSPPWEDCIIPSLLKMICPQICRPLIIWISYTYKRNQINNVKGVANSILLCEVEPIRIVVDPFQDLKRAITSGLSLDFLLVGNLPFLRWSQTQSPSLSTNSFIPLLPLVAYTFIWLSIWFLTLSCNFITISDLDTPFFMHKKSVRWKGN